MLSGFQLPYDSVVRYEFSLGGFNFVLSPPKEEFISEFSLYTNGIHRSILRQRLHDNKLYTRYKVVSFRKQCLIGIKFGMHLTLKQRLKLLNFERKC